MLFFEGFNIQALGRWRNPFSGLIGCAITMQVELAHSAGWRNVTPGLRLIPPHYIFDNWCTLNQYPKQWVQELHDTLFTVTANLPDPMELNQLWTTWNSRLMAKAVEIADGAPCLFTESCTNPIKHVSHFSIFWFIVCVVVLRHLLPIAYNTAGRTWVSFPSFSRLLCITPLQYKVNQCSSIVYMPTDGVIQSLQILR